MPMGNVNGTLNSTAYVDNCYLKKTKTKKNKKTFWLSGLERLWCWFGAGEFFRWRVTGCWWGREVGLLGSIKLSLCASSVAPDPDPQSWPCCGPESLSSCTPELLFV